MALNNYANLKTAITNWTHRGDLGDLHDDIILLAEATMYQNEDAMLRVREMEVSDSTSTGSQTLALPTGYVDSRKLTITQSGTEFDCRYRSPESMQKKTDAGRPEQFTITSQYEFNRPLGGTYTINRSYLAKATGLSSSNTTNAILTNYPNIYLFGCKWAAALYAGEDAKAQTDYLNFIKAIRGANKSYKKGQHGPAAVMATEGSTP